MKKKFLLGLSVCMCLGLAGCGDKGKASLNTDSNKALATSVKSQSEKEVQSMTTTEETTEATMETTTEVAIVTTEDAKPAGVNSNVALTDNLYDFQMSIDGQVIQFPILLSDLQAMGFEYDNSKNKMLPANHVTFAEVAKYKDATFYLNLVNYDINEKPFTDCLVYGVSVDDFLIGDSKVEIKTAKGITLMKSNMDDVKAAFGEPTDTYDDAEYPSFKYTLENYRTVEFHFETSKGNVLTKIEIDNRYKPEDFVEGKVDESVPEITKAYKAPTALTDNLYDYVFEFAGDLYTCPMPLTEMINNGWTVLDGAENEVVAGKGFTSMDLTRDNQTVRIYVRNYSSNSTTANNCFVTQIRASEYLCDVDMKLANGIYKGMPVADLEKALEGYTVKRDSSASHEYYEIDDINSMADGYDIIVKDGVVIEIEIDYTPKQAEMNEKYGVK